MSVCRPGRLRRGALIGDPHRVAELGSVHEPRPHRLLARRMDQLTEELGFERERIRGWAIAQAVLSAWWHLEDTGDSESEDWEIFLALTQVMASVK